MIGCGLIFALCSLGIPVKILERSFEGDNAVDGLEYYSNIVWMLMITMTTAGYGDFYPSTLLGRAVCFVACFLGMALTSLLIVWLSLIGFFDKEESIAYTSIKIDKARRNLHDSAVDTIKKVFQTKTQSDIISNIQGHIELRRVAHKFYSNFQSSMQIDANFSEIKYEMFNTLNMRLLGLKKQINHVSQLEPRVSALILGSSKLIKKLEKAKFRQ